jgi:ribosomal protein S18 acetylase RimI-like enzyme
MLVLARWSPTTEESPAMEVADKIRKAVPEDLPRIGSALRRAFFDDPLFEWAIQDDGRRQRFLLGFFSQYAKAFLRHDETYTTGGEVVAAALWAPPGAEPVSSKDAEELGRLIEELAGPDASRFLDLTKLFDDHHPHGSYWYLQFMGVMPGWQGQGIGSALVAPMLKRCDREGVRAYLDATSERNKRLYERHGFEAKDPFAAPGGLPVWPMWRQPASDR